MTGQMRIVFMGSPDFAVPSLNALVEAGHEMVAAYCQPPRPAGRGKQERKSPVPPHPALRISCPDGTRVVTPVGAHAGVTG